ncbi:tetratricopeptide repeat protein [uncultured Flavobacterium sp.]|uniref:tetratricopeptide repeat protein n=1 Tax=uncultured Flavobacterium sp. TaxID=165435 RepID=UPI0026157B88|nr:tetratricopeptide repeat protein [uncultured Flavobacterium sp.]
MKLLLLTFLSFFSLQMLFSQNITIAENHNDKAIDELMLGNNKTALYEINQALKINPKNANYYYIRGMILQKMNDLNKALIDYKKTLSLNSKHIDATIKCAIVYAKLNDKTKSCEYFKKACDLGDSKACEGYYKFCN